MRCIVGFVTLVYTLSSYGTFFKINISGSYATARSLPQN